LAINRIQRGQTALANAANPASSFPGTRDVTITSVNTGSAFVKATALTPSSLQTGIAYLTSATNLRLQGNPTASGSAGTVAWEVIEFA